MVSEKTFNVLAVYKVFWPPETKVQLTKKFQTEIQNINPWPPPEQVPLLEVKEDKPKRETNFG